MKYRIVKCVVYDRYTKTEKHWFEVEYLSNVKTWWFFGERVWKTFKEPVYSSAGAFNINLKFATEMEAREFINRCRTQSNGIVKEIVWELCGYERKIK